MPPSSIAKSSRAELLVTSGKGTREAPRRRRTTKVKGRLPLRAAHGQCVGGCAGPSERPPSTAAPIRLTEARCLPLPRSNEERPASRSTLAPAAAHATAPHPTARSSLRRHIWKRCATLLRARLHSLTMLGTNALPLLMTFCRPYPGAMFISFLLGHQLAAVDRLPGFSLRFRASLGAGLILRRGWRRTQHDTRHQDEQCGARNFHGDLPKLIRSTESA